MFIISVLKFRISKIIYKSKRNCFRRQSVATIVAINLKTGTNLKGLYDFRID